MKKNSDFFVQIQQKNTNKTANRQKIKY